MKTEFTIFGFKFNIRKTLITLAIACVLFIVLLILDMYVTDISWYGVIIGCGFLVALFVAMQLAKNRGLEPDFVFDLILWIFPLSIVGARVYYVLNDLDSFETFGEMIAVWNGGMAIYGGIIGGVIGLVICCLIKKKNIIASMDMAAPALILAQSIGRWGNFINQEVYGFQVTNKAWQWFPFAVHITENGLDQWHLATFFYESIF